MSEHREITAELRNTLPNHWHTPAWTQPEMPSRHPIGCGPLAWGIVYGYWRAFKRRERLFDGFDVVRHSNFRDSGAPELVQAFGAISDDTETNYGGEAMNRKFGLTWPGKMPQGIEYAKRLGYRSASCARIRGTEFNKFDAIKRHLDADKPVILLIKDSDRRGLIPNHYVVIEAAVKTQEKYLRKWHDRDVKYLVNFGHGPYVQNAREWIYVRVKGRNDHKIWTADSAFLPSV